MRQLWLPLLCDKESFVAQQGGGTFIASGMSEYRAFTSHDKAKEYAKELAIAHPQAKVVIFKAVGLIEPRKIEFAEKQYNDSGELVI